MVSPGGGWSSWCRGGEAGVDIGNGGDGEGGQRCRPRNHFAWQRLPKRAFGFDRQRPRRRRRRRRRRRGSCCRKTGRKAHGCCGRGLAESGRRHGVGQRDARRRRHRQRGRKRRRQRRRRRLRLSPSAEPLHPHRAGDQRGRRQRGLVDLLDLLHAGHGHLRCLAALFTGASSSHLLSSVGLRWGERLGERRRRLELGIAESCDDLREVCDPGMLYLLESAWAGRCRRGGQRRWRGGMCGAPRGGGLSAIGRRDLAEGDGAEERRCPRRGEHLSRSAHCLRPAAERVRHCDGWQRYGLRAQGGHDGRNGRCWRRDRTVSSAVAVVHWADASTSTASMCRRRCRASGRCGLRACGRQWRGQERFGAL